MAKVVPKIDSFYSKPDLICYAIKNKHVISFTYHGKDRVGDPQCCGINDNGNEAVRVFMKKGGSVPEQLFLLSKTENLNLLNQHFTKPGPNYKRDDAALKRKIFCQL